VYYWKILVTPRDAIVAAR